MQNFYLEKDSILEDLGNGIVRKICGHNGSLMMVKIYFQEGAVGKLHSHPHEQMTYVLEGQFEFIIGNKKRIVKEGDVLYKEANISHGAICLEKGILLDIFTPIREDFLKE